MLKVLFLSVLARLDDQEIKVIVKSAKALATTIQADLADDGKITRDEVAGILGAAGSLVLTALVSLRD